MTGVDSSRQRVPRTKTPADQSSDWAAAVHLSVSWRNAVCFDRTILQWPASVLWGKTGHVLCTAGASSDKAWNVFWFQLAANKADEKLALRDHSGRVWERAVLPHSAHVVMVQYWTLVDQRMLQSSFEKTSVETRLAVTSCPRTLRTSFKHRSW